MFHCDLVTIRNICEFIASGAGTNSGNKSSSPTKSSEPSAAPTSQPKSSTPNSNYPEADVKKLMDYGFTRQQVIDELTRAGGNVDQALAALFAKSFQMPS